MIFTRLDMKEKSFLFLVEIAVQTGYFLRN